MDNKVMEHGTRTMYNRGGCRCDACRAANTAYQLATTERRKERLAADPTLAPHGRLSTYGNWGCRCEECTAANNAQSRAYYPRRKAKR